MRACSVVAALAVVAFGVFAGCVGDAPIPAGGNYGDGGPTDDGGPGGEGGDGAVSALTVAAAVASVSVVASQNVTLDVTITRANGFSGAVKVSLVGLPSGVTAPDVTITADQTKGTFSIATTDAASQGVVTVTVTATSVDSSVGANASVELVVRGLPGTIDASYAGTGSLAYTDLAIASIAIQKDDKIVLGGSAPASGPFGDNYGAVRVTTDGKLDTTFGTGGLYKVTLGSPTPGKQFVRSVGVDDATGMITLAGIAVSDKQRLGLVRVDSTGKLDPTLGLKGFGPDSTATGVRARAFGGNTYIGGFASTILGGDTVIGKVGPAGFDTTFGTAGMSTGTSYLKVYDMLIQTDGKYVFCGIAGPDGGDENATLLRFNPDGSTDTGFGTGGVYVYDEPSTQESCLGMALLSDGRIIFVGARGSGNVLVVVLLTNGTVDNTFHENITTPGQANFVLPQADGTIVVIGAGAYVWRILPSGAPDPTLNGGTPSAVGNASFPTKGAAVDSHQRVIMATSSALYRYWL